MPVLRSESLKQPQDEYPDVSVKGMQVRGQYLSFILANVSYSAASVDVEVWNWREGRRVWVSSRFLRASTRLTL